MMRLLFACLSTLMVVGPAGASAALFTVTNTNDSGPGSLRQAILDSNRTAGPNVIEIAIEGTPPYVIKPQGQFLPPLKGPVVVRVKPAAPAGRGAAPAGPASFIGPPPVVVLDGSSLIKPRTPDACPGATVTYNTQTNQWESSRVMGSGPNVRGYFGAGLAVHDSKDVEISGLEIRNFCVGVAVVRSNGVYLHDLKIVDSHGAAGVIFTGDDGNATSTPTCFNNTLLNSVLLDNGDGFEFTHGAHDSILQGNLIALTQPLPADGNAVEFDSSGDNNAVMGNTFSKYVSTAVTISGNNHTIRDNTFSENAGSGMRAGGANLLIFGNTFTKNGGPALSVSGAGTRVLDNVVTDNKGPGIVVSGPRITLSRNSIHANARLGIDGSLPELPAAPILTDQSKWTSTDLVIAGSLSAAANRTYKIEIFVSRAPDRHPPEEQGQGEGERYLGTAAAVTDASGRATFRLAMRLPDPFGDGMTAGFVTATTTDPDGSTSKFSKALQMTKSKGPT